MLGYINRFKILIIILIAASIYSYINYLRPIEKNPNIDKTSNLYINDLYQSDGLHYKSLNDNERLLYLEFIKTYKKQKANVEVDLSKYGCEAYTGCEVSLLKTWNAVMLDHPELLQLSGISYRYYSDSPIVNVYLNSGIYFDFQYTLGVLKIERVVDKIKKATKDINEKQKVEYVYKWMGDHNKYDKVFTYTNKNQSAYSSLINHSGVCAAYAKASQIVFQNIGIESYAIRGRSTGEHMWNMVKVDGNYYYYDSTVSSALKETSPNYYDGLLQSYVGKFTVYEKELYPTTNPTEYFINN